MQRDSGAPLYEFFAGGGLARLGLEPDFACVFANDIDAHKAAAYRRAFGGDDLREGPTVYVSRSSSTPAQSPRLA